MQNTQSRIEQVLVSLSDLMALLSDIDYDVTRAFESQSLVTVHIESALARLEGVTHCLHSALEEIEMK